MSWISEQHQFVEPGRGAADKLFVIDTAVVGTAGGGGFFERVAEKAKMLTASFLLTLAFLVLLRLVIMLWYRHVCEYDATIKARVPLDRRSIRRQRKQEQENT